jgi:hypothetical protein
MALADSIVGITGKILDKFVEDKDQRAKMLHELDMSVQESNIAQIYVNMEQAKHPSIFVAGARPAIMWIAALGLFWSFFLAPVLNWIMVVSGTDVPLPEIETEGLLTLTLALLGLGGMRSFEKSKGVARENLQ